MTWVVIILLIILAIALPHISVLIMIISFLIYFFRIKKKNINPKKRNTKNSKKKESQTQNKQENINNISSYIESNYINQNNYYPDSLLLDGLKVGEILLIEWLSNKKQSSLPPQYFAATYNINTNTSITKLKHHNFIRTATPSESLISLKVIDLKNILKLNNLKMSGNKSELIQRIIDNISESEYAHRLSPSWHLTKKGQRIVDKYDLIIWTHKNGSKDFTVTPLTVLPYLNSGKSNEEIAIFVSEKTFRGNLIELNYGAACSNLLYQSDIYESQNNLHQSLHCLLASLVLELTGVGNSDPDYINIHKYNIDTSYIKASIIDVQRKLQLTNKELELELSETYDFYIANVSKIRLYKDKKEFTSLYNILMYGTMKQFQNKIDKLIEKLPKKYTTIGG